MNDKIDTSWRQDYLGIKSGLSKSEIKLLEEGPHSLSQSWHLQAMYNDWKVLKGYKDTPPPDCQSSLKEFFAKHKEQGI